MADGLTRGQLWLLDELDAPARASNPAGRGGGYEGLSEQQLRFVDAYLVSLNATQAAREAGYSGRSAQVQGSRLLSNVMVRAELKRRLEELRSRGQLTVEGTLEQLRKLAHADVRTLYDREGRFKAVADWPDDISVRIAGVETEETHEREDRIGAPSVLVTTRVVKVKYWNPNEALKTIAQYLQMLVDGGHGMTPAGAIDADYEDMTPDDLVREALRIGERVGAKLTDVP